MKFSGIIKNVLFLVQVSFILLFSITSYAQVDRVLNSTELDDLVAPIALYPDAMISHILPAATQPLQIVQAARYIKENGGTVDSVPQNDWDPSIKALLEAPAILNNMNEKLSWTVELGDAVIAQQDDVLTAIQRVRVAAQNAGKLESNDMQIIIVEQEVIKIEPAQPQVIYVPQYYYVPSTHTTVVVHDHYAGEAAFIGFTMGLIIGAAIVDDHWHHHHYVNWHHGHINHGWSNVDINVNRNTNIDLGDRTINRGDKNFQGQPWQPSQNARKQFDARRKDTPRVQSEQLRATLDSNATSKSRNERLKNVDANNRYSTNKDRDGRKQDSKVSQRSQAQRDSVKRNSHSAGNSAFSNARNSRDTTRQFSKRGNVSRSGGGQRTRRR